jgi:hypothetical protein
MKNFQQIVAIGCFGLIWGTADIAVINSYSHDIEGVARAGGLLTIVLIFGSWFAAAPAWWSGWVVWRYVFRRRQESAKATSKTSWP